MNWQSISSHGATVLAVDDVPENLEILAAMLERQGFRALCVSSPKTALHLAIQDPPDIFLLDVQMPEMDGYELCRRLKAIHSLEDVPVIFVSALSESIDKVRAFATGGVDYITKPFHMDEVRARLDTHLRIRKLNQELRRTNEQLQELVQEQVRAIVDSHLAAMFAMAKLAESRDDDTGDHIRRVQTYCRVLATELSKDSSFQRQMDDRYIDTLFHAAPLHDIGKVGIPDSVLLKPARLTSDELEVMKSHTTIGARTLEDVLRMYPDNSFLEMGLRLTKSHHEKWDGSGYPEGLREEEIPLSARILAFADQYDALRSARPYKQAMDHRTARDIILKGDGRTSPDHFDPRILQVFRRSENQFEVVFQSFQHMPAYGHAAAATACAVA